MELGLSLGDTLHDEKPLNDLIDISNEKYYDDALGFCMRLTRPYSSNFLTTTEEMNTKTDPSAVQLHLLPFSPLPNPFPCLLLQPQNQNFLNLKHSVDAGTSSSSSCSPNSSMMSSFRKEFAVYRRDHHHHHHHNHAVEADRSEYIYNSRKIGSDDEDEKNGVLLSRKKLRLTKDQSAFLEHSFKLHHTLNPKQKLALAKQLKLGPRQVEVWFQNRRARTKLKQTEVDCEYLKRCCETLREENKRLQKEVQELRALKSCKPYMQLLPPTTLTMCPSCERLTPPTTATVAAAAAAPPPPPPDTKPKPPRLHTFLQEYQEYQSHALQAS